MEHLRTSTGNPMIIRQARTVIKANVGIWPRGGRSVLDVQCLSHIESRHVRKEVLVFFRCDRCKETVIVNVQIMPRLTESVRSRHEEFAVCELTIRSHFDMLSGIVQNELLTKSAGVIAEFTIVFKFDAFEFEMFVPLMCHIMDAALPEEVRGPGFALIPKQIVNGIVDQPILVSVPATVEGET